jgi:hypothetical protein
MKRLNPAEINVMADYLCMSVEEATEVAEIFANILETEQGGQPGGKIYTPLNNVEDYIREWEDHWHREDNWTEFYGYEMDNCIEAYPDVLDSIDRFKNYVIGMGIAYELSNGLIIVVC